ncbi:MAG: hypothetical protein KDD64_10050 [Bdellovibrionales bacterium]|nr:hypothetical protein [Bdellovibrionales bacterium]
MRWSLIFIPLLVMGAARISVDELVSTSVVISNGGFSEVVDLYCGGGAPYALKTRGTRITPKPYATLVRRAKKKFTIRGVGKSSLRRLRKINKAGKSACLGLEPNGTPTPTPTPSQDEGYFNSAGDVTALGKQVFEIPSQLRANIWDGMIIWEQTCGCHELRSKSTMPLIREAILQEPMYFDQAALPDEDLANITAWLLKFRSPELDSY